MSKNLIFRFILVGLIIGICWGADVFFQMGPVAWIFALIWSGLALFWSPAEHLSWDNRKGFKAAIDDPKSAAKINRIVPSDEH